MAGSASRPSQPSLYEDSFSAMEHYPQRQSSSRDVHDLDRSGSLSEFNRFRKPNLHGHRQSAVNNGNIDSLRGEYENDKEWNLRKKFILLNSGSLNMDRLFCLSRCFVNIALYGCSYPWAVTKEVQRRSAKILGEGKSEKKIEAKLKYAVSFVKGSSNPEASSMDLPDDESVDEPETIQKVNSRRDSQNSKTSLAGIRPETQTSKTSLASIRPETQTSKTSLAGIRPETQTLKTSLASIRPETQTLKTSLASIRPETQTSKTSLASIRPETQTSKTSLAGIRPETQTLKTSLASIRPETQTLKTSLASIRPETQASKTSLAGIRPETQTSKTSLAGIRPETQASKTSLAGIRPETQASKTSLASIRPETQASKTTFGNTQNSKTSTIRHRYNIQNTQAGGGIPETQISSAAKFILRRTHKKQIYLSKEQCLTASQLEPNPTLRKIRKLAYEVMNLKSTKSCGETKLKIASCLVPVTIDFQLDQSPSVGKNAHAYYLLVNDIQIIYHQAAMKKARRSTCKKGINLMRLQDIEVVPVDLEGKGVVAYGEEMSEKNVDAWQKYDGSLLNSTVNREMSAGKNYDSVGGGLNFHQRANLSSDQSQSGMKTSQGVLSSDQSQSWMKTSQAVSSSIQSEGNTSDDEWVDEPETVCQVNSRCDSLDSKTAFGNTQNSNPSRQRYRFRRNNQNTQATGDIDETQISKAAKFILRRTQNKLTYLTKEQCLTASQLEPNPIIRKIRKLAYEVMNVKSTLTCPETRLKVAGGRIPVAIDIQMELFPRLGKNVYSCHLLVNDLQVGYRKATMNKARRSACKKGINLMKLRDIEVVPVDLEGKAVIVRDEEMSETNIGILQNYDGSLLNSTVNQEMSTGKNYDIVGGGLNFHQRANLSSDQSQSWINTSQAVSSLLQSEGNTLDDENVDEPETVRQVNSRCDSLNSKTAFGQFRPETQTSKTAFGQFRPETQTSKTAFGQFRPEKQTSNTALANITSETEISNAAKFIIRRTQNKLTHLTKEQCFTASQLEPNPILRKIRKLAYEFMNLKTSRTCPETILKMAGCRVPVTIDSKMEFLPRLGNNVYTCQVLVNDIQVGYHRGTKNKARKCACKKAIKTIKLQDIEVVPVEPEMKAVIAHDEEMLEKNFDAWQKYDGSLLNLNVNREMSAGKNYDIVGGGLNFHQRSNLSSDHSLSGVRASEGVLSSGQSPKLSLGNQNLSVIRKGPPCSHMKGVADSLVVTRDVCDVTANETQSENVPDKGCIQDATTDPQSKTRPDIQNSENELDNTGYKTQTSWNGLDNTSYKTQISNTAMRSYGYNTPKIKTALSLEECFVAYEMEQNPVLKKIRNVAYEVLNIRKGRNIPAKKKLKNASNRVSVLIEFKSDYVPCNPSGNYLHRVMIGDIELASSLGINKKRVRKTACDTALKTILMPKIEIVEFGNTVRLQGSVLSPKENLNRLMSTPSKTFLQDSAASSSQVTKLPGERAIYYRVVRNQPQFQKEFINVDQGAFNHPSKTFLWDSAEGSSQVSELPFAGASLYKEPHVNSAGFKRSQDQSKLPDKFIVVQEAGSVLESAEQTLKKSSVFNHALLAYEFAQQGEATRCIVKINDEVCADVFSSSKSAAKATASVQCLEKLKSICWLLKIKQTVDTHSTVSKEDVEEIELTSDKIGSDNIGNKLLQKMGWAGGGIGKKGQGIAEPVSLMAAMKRQGLGFGGASRKVDDFKKRVREYVRDYCFSGNQEDLVFSFDFDYEERKFIKEECRILNLQILYCQKRQDKYLCVSRKRSANDLFEYVKECGGETPKYKLLAPGTDVGTDSLALGTDSLAPGTDVGTDSLAQGRDVWTDSLAPGTDSLAPGRDSLAPGTDVGTDSLAPGRDVGADSLAPGTDVGTDSLAPGTDVGADSLAPGTDVRTDVRTDSSTTFEKCADSVE